MRVDELINIHVACMQIHYLKKNLLPPMPTPFNQNQSSRQKIPNCENVGDLLWFAHLLDLQLEVTSVPPFKSELGCSLAFSFLPLGFVILSFPNSKTNCVRLGDRIRELGFVEFTREQLVDFWATWIVNQCLSCGHFSGNSNEFTDLVALQEVLSRPIQFLSAGVTTDPFNAVGNHLYCYALCGDCSVGRRGGRRSRRRW